MKLVIRADAPLMLQGLIEPLKRLGIWSDQKHEEGIAVGNRLQEQAQKRRAECPDAAWDEAQWAAEEAALLMIMAHCPSDGHMVSWFLQRLMVPADIPLSFLELLTGWEIREKAQWRRESISLHAILWLKEMGAKPMPQLHGTLLRIERGDDLAVLVMDEDFVGEKEIPTLLEHRDHSVEHVDEGMLIMQVNLDDSSPEWLAYVLEQCMRAGANDVHFLPVTMKKSRPGTLLQVMCYQSAAEAIKTILFSETTTFGIRTFPVACHRLARRFATAQTQWGEVQVKLGYHRGKRVQVAPEYAVCAQLAEAAQVPLKQVYQEAIRLAVEKVL
ncbi:nickel insertion protein [Brevibacillus centrosporus]|uniref:nickel insertion protein n=1 Tax=Brevibacillus centrosporus TaxID=54910 RepID=UPI003D229407